jgi:hypothetical protein
MSSINQMIYEFVLMPLQDLSLLLPLPSCILREPSFILSYLLARKIRLVSSNTLRVPKTKGSQPYRRLYSCRQPNGQGVCGNNYDQRT